MTELYSAFFHIQKHGKISEKAMLARTAITVVVIVVCLAAMGITAYAYFSYNVTSSSSIIKAANFEADVVISITNNTGKAVPVPRGSNHAKTAELKAGNTYHIVLEESTSSTASTGFVIISSPACKEVYHTQQLGNDTHVEGGRTEKIIFDLKVTEDTVVSFISHWGTSSHYADYADKGNGGKLYITNANIGDNAVVMTTNGVTNSASESDDQVTDSTEATTPTTELTEVMHTVVAEENVTQIAEQYGTTVAHLAAYNGISDPNSIQVGQEIKIPPANWQMPGE